MGLLAERHRYVAEAAVAGELEMLPQAPHAVGGCSVKDHAFKHCCLSRAPALLSAQITNGLTCDAEAAVAGELALLPQAPDAVGGSRTPRGSLSQRHISQLLQVGSLHAKLRGVLPLSGL